MFAISSFVSELQVNGITFGKAVFYVVDDYRLKKWKEEKGEKNFASFWHACRDKVTMYIGYIRQW